MRRDTQINPHSLFLKVRDREVLDNILRGKIEGGIPRRAKTCKNV